MSAHDKGYSEMRHAQYILCICFYYRNNGEDLDSTYGFKNQLPLSDNPELFQVRNIQVEIWNKKKSIHNFTLKDYTMTNIN